MLKLSEAIRLGSLLRPQGFETVYSAMTGDQVLPESDSCAMGAAFEAASCKPKYEFSSGTNNLRGESNFAGFSLCVQIPKEWQDLLVTSAQCPTCLHEDPLRRMIAHWNDKHHFTREAIADYVEKFEQVQAQKPVALEHEHA